MVESPLGGIAEQGMRTGVCDGDRLGLAAADAPLPAGAGVVPPLPYLGAEDARGEARARAVRCGPGAFRVDDHSRTPAKPHTARTMTSAPARNVADLFPLR